MQSVPPKAAAVLKTAADEAFKLGPDGLPKFMASEPMDKDPKIVESDAMKYLQSLAWTGNVRELRNVVERLVIMCNDVITLDDVKLFAMPMI